MAASASSSANIVKILINYSEYARLKDIEEKYTHLQKKYKDKLHIEEGNAIALFQTTYFLSFDLVYLHIT